MNLLGLASVILDGIAYGMLLFLFSIGLSVTLGLMRFINLAHGAFAMCGGYIAVVLLNQFGVPYVLTLIPAFVLTGLVGIGAERLVIRHLYRRSELQQVLFSIGLAFAAGAVADIFFGPNQQPVLLPDWMVARYELFGLGLSGYRLFIIASGIAALIVLLALFNATLFGARVRAAVDRRQTAEGIGINVGKLFALTFGLGAGFAGFGGALAVGFLGLDPTFPLKFLVIVLMVVAIGGPGSTLGSLGAALFLGFTDALFKYLLPEVGGFVIYGVLVLVMIFMPQGFAGRKAA